MGRVINSRHALVPRQKFAALPTFALRVDVELPALQTVLAQAVSIAIRPREANAAIITGDFGVERFAFTKWAGTGWCFGMQIEGSHRETSVTRLRLTL